MQNETIYPEMTIEEIETQFDGEWVLFGDPEINEYLEVVRGKVLSHSADRDEVNRFMAPLPDDEFRRLASLYNGDVPRGTAVLL